VISGLPARIFQSDFPAFNYLCQMENEDNHLHAYVYSAEMVEFVTSANEFCRFLEQLNEVDGRLFIEGTVSLLSRIYAAVIRIGETEPVNDSPLEVLVTEMEWNLIEKRISTLLGAHNDYIRPATEDEFDRSELVTQTISEDVADIYQEMRDFIHVYSRGLEALMSDAAWEVKQRFGEHWGIKLLRSLTALHPLYVNGIDPGADLETREKEDWWGQDF